MAQVTLREGKDLAAQFNSANFFEVSVADKPYESISILEKVVRDIIITKKVIVYDTTKYNKRCIFVNQLFQNFH